MSSSFPPLPPGSAWGFLRPETVVGARVGFMRGVGSTYQPFMCSLSNTSAEFCSTGTLKGHQPQVLPGAMSRQRRRLRVTMSLWPLTHGGSTPAIVACVVSFRNRSVRGFAFVESQRWGRQLVCRGDGVPSIAMGNRHMSLCNQGRYCWSVFGMFVLAMSRLFRAVQTVVERPSLGATSGEAVSN